MGGTAGCGKILRLILLAGLLSGAVRAAEAPGPDAFTEAFKKAIVENDRKTLLSFADGEGPADAARESQVESWLAMFPSRDVFSVSLGPLPVDFPPFFIMHGRRFDPSHPPAGIVTLSFRQDGGLTSKQLAYTIVDGHYKIVATKVTDLGWKGPKDVNIAYVLEGQGAESAVVKVRFNASGVDLERSFLGPSITLWGQHVSGIEVTCDDPKTSVFLKVLRDGKEIYRSEILKGAGKILYAGDLPQAAKTE